MRRSNKVNGAPECPKTKTIVNGVDKSKWLVLNTIEMAFE